MHSPLVEAAVTVFVACRNSASFCLSALAGVAEIIARCELLLTTAVLTSQVFGTLLCCPRNYKVLFVIAWETDGICPVASRHAKIIQVREKGNSAAESFTGCYLFTEDSTNGQTRSDEGHVSSIRLKVLPCRAWVGRHRAALLVVATCSS